MGNMAGIAKRKARGANLPSNSTKATVNRAGGVAFDINDPAVKLITMCGGSFFMEISSNISINPLSSSGWSCGS